MSEESKASIRMSMGGFLLMFLWVAVLPSALAFARCTTAPQLDYWDVLMPLWGPIAIVAGVFAAMLGLVVAAALVVLAFLVSGVSLFVVIAPVMWAGSSIGEALDDRRRRRRDVLDDLRLKDSPLLCKPGVLRCLCGQMYGFKDEGEMLGATCKCGRQWRMKPAEKDGGE